MRVTPSNQRNKVVRVGGNHETIRNAQGLPIVNRPKDPTAPLFKAGTAPPKHILGDQGGANRKIFPKGDKNKQALYKAEASMQREVTSEIRAPKHVTDSIPTKPEENDYSQLQSNAELPEEIYNTQAVEADLDEDPPEIKPKKKINVQGNIKTPYYVKDRALSARHRRIELPSNCIPYDFDYIQIRPFEIMDLAKLARVSVTNDFTGLLDVLDGCTDQDLRILTPGDFRFILYWERVNCLPANTLIATDKGLLKIRDMVSVEKGKAKKGEVQNINTLVGGRFGNEKTTKWVYNGKKQTFKIKTGLGNILDPTSNHPLLVFNEFTGTTEYRTTDNCKVGDTLCINIKQPKRIEPLKLTFKEHIKVKFSHNVNDVIKPRVMTPDLAFILGLIISEGYISKNTVVFSNTNTKLLKYYNEKILKIFGLVSSTFKAKQKSFIINGVKTQSSMNCYSICTSSIILSKMLNELGCYSQTGRRNGKTPSHYKVIPWSILQADEQSQLAFLAAYLEGDGRVCNFNHTLSWISASNKLLKDMQILLNTHGVCPTLLKNGICVWLKLGVSDSQKIWKKLQPYMLHKNLEKVRNHKSHGQGVPKTYWRELINERRVPGKKWGSRFINDDGVMIKFEKLRDKFLVSHTLKTGVFYYQDYREGKLEEILNFLKIVSISAYNKLINLLELEYRFTRIKSKKPGKIKDVYDLSIEDGKEPSFIANGLIVHNSYLASPYKLSYTSRYGNVNEITINNSTLKYDVLKMTQEEYDEYHEMGIVCPTMRDQELVKDLDTESPTYIEDLWLFEHTQYLVGDTPQEKIDLLKAGGIELVEKIREYDLKINHGVVETIECVDKHFNPEEAIKRMRENGERLRRSAIEMPDSANALQVLDRVQEMFNEADLIENTIKSGEIYIPAKEVVTLNIDVTRFFPAI